MPPSPPCRNASASSSCISRILRRILCFNALPLRSFDHERAVTDEPSCTPSLMARLMGLETLPLVEASPATSAADSSRLRSRRIIPPYRELEDENFFILSFEGRKAGRGSRRRRRGGKGKENEEVNVVLGRDLEVGIEGGFRAGLTLKNSGREPEKMEDELENSSPNSVLEFVGFANDHESDSPEEVSRLANSKTRRPLPLPDEIDSSGNSRERKSITGSDESCGTSRERKPINNSNESSENSRERKPITSSDESCGNSRERKPINNRDDEIDSRARIKDAEKWDEIGELAATDTMKSSWLREEMTTNRHCFAEIGRDLESSILDHLLEELLIDLEIF